MRDVWCCPVLTCGWAYNLPPNDGSASFTRSLAAVVDSHAAEHPVCDYLATITDLQRRIEETA